MNLKEDKLLSFLRLVLKRVRFRDSYFGEVAKTNLHFVQIETGFFCEIGRGYGTRAICLFARVILEQFSYRVGFWTWKIRANVDYCYVWRRAECTSLGPGLKRPSLR